MSILVDKITKVTTQGMTGKAIMRSRRLSAVVLALACSIASPTQAQDTSAPALIPTFSDMCLMPGVDHQDRVTKIEQSSAWQKDAAVSLNVAGLHPSRSIGGKPNFTKVEDATQWSGEVDGMKAHMLLLTFPEKSRYRHACVLVVEGLENAMEHGGELRAAFKEFGVGGKSVDLVHYYEFAGTLKPGKHPVTQKQPIHGEIFSRSQAGFAEKTTHIYVAY